MPTYNSEKWIKYAIDSILNQTFSNFELIIIDDGSTDKTLEILHEYEHQDQRITIYIQGHRGGGVARNYGLDKANGKYVLFLDSDDFFEPKLLERCTEVAKYCNPDICIYDIYEYNELLKKDRDYATWCIKKKYLPKNNPFSPNDVKNYIFNAFSNNPWNKMFNMDFLKDNNIKFQSINRTNDLFFVCANLCLSRKIFYLDEKLMHYRTHTETSCQATNHMHPFDFIYAFNNLKELLLRKNIYTVFNISFINHKIDACAYNLLSLKEYIAFKKLYRILQIWLEKDIKLIKNNKIYKKLNYNICRDIINMSIDDFLSKHEKSVNFSLNKTHLNTVDTYTASDLIGDKVKIDGIIYTLVTPNNKETKCLSIKNQSNNLFLRHINGKMLETDKQVNPMSFAMDSSFVPEATSDGFVLHCSNKNMENEYICRVDIHSYIVHSKHAKFLFRPIK